MSLFAKIRKGDQVALSQAITLIESSLDTDKLTAQKLIADCLPFSGNSIRIGITGAPGVGKSTFINSFGLLLANSGKKIAVLAIDPSSTISQGSILGDKTRMGDLSINENAFIRPSPTYGTLGGITNKTRENIILCEAAGFDIILIETVGVGQSETTIKQVVDFLLLLVLADAGDELQAIKRGIMEMADAIIINKVDGDNITKAQQACLEYKNALLLFPSNTNQWKPEVSTCSAFEHKGIQESWKIIKEHNTQTIKNGHFELNRKQQYIYWVHHLIKNELGNKKYHELKDDNKLSGIENVKDVYRWIDKL